MSAAVIVQKQNKIIKAFRDAGAIDALHTRTCEDLHLRNGLILGSLVRHEVLVETSEGRFYLDPARAEAFVRSRRIRVIAIAAVALVAIALILIFK